MRKVLVTYGKHTHVTPKKTQSVAEEGDYSKFLVVLNFQFAFQYTHMFIFFREKLIGKTFLEIGSGPVS